MTAFADRTALVTGAGRGIGRAIALALAAEGAEVVLVARSAEQLEEGRGLVRAAGGTAEAVVANLGTERGVLDLTEHLAETDILVNNAASLGRIAATSGRSRSEWEGLVALNLLAPVQLTSIALPGMTRRGWGRVANISAGIASRQAAILGGSPYAVSKAASRRRTPPSRRRSRPRQG